ncbi:acrylyl-CoA reductase (NADPH) [Homoserinimonas aerilata]|uniref:Acrylyl-CoA reductase (NADPH) n=1 Tax=Homoserinimonas aerilata TaxID=1162970 RepID=A0A542XX11_9MICO|nr:MDR family oxidoreductase [Homoserinimonas aerilata]TQL40374.1 acrylyl-CoA reductase (NADPH) [Homoserinimonas aerilata]
MRALWTTKTGDTVSTELTELPDDTLMPGDVTVDVDFSSINYKDGMAIMGRPGIIRNHPLVPGIDFVGTVADAAAGSGFAPGDRVILNGWGVGETHHGGLAERARVKSEWLVPLPEAISPQRAAAIGTAGFTAMLAVLALERSGALENDGSVLVTGAAGGVGSIAIAVLSRLGHRVTASTGRLDEADYLRSLGASDVIDRAQFSEPGKPLQEQRWIAAVDSAGGNTLANVLAQLEYGGTVAACGLAESAGLPSTVLPFILRSANLMGINSVNAPHALRVQAWDRLARNLDLELLDSLTTTVGLTDAKGVAEQILAGQVRGRTVVDVRR